jgi:3'(2'), 5'-bisphosphate nucleotidase
VGQQLVEISHKKLTFDQKEDQSPVTIADKLAHTFLCEHLPSVLDIPIVSEEAPHSFEDRKGWEKFWLIDPLDGTKEFLAGEKDYCINVALIAGNRPVLGMIHGPALKETYIAEKGKGVKIFGSKVHARKDSKIIVGTSRFHHSLQTHEFIERNGFKFTFPIGAALKFCRLVTQEIDIYPRFEGSSEWDVAAGHLMVEEAGGYMIDLTTQASPVYNKPSHRNNHFVAARGHIDFNSLIFAEEVRCVPSF